jgi:hypothetical protein
MINFNMHPPRGIVLQTQTARTIGTIVLRLAAVTRAYLARKTLPLNEATPATRKNPRATRELAALRGIVFQPQTARTIGTIVRRLAPRNTGLSSP